MNIEKKELVQALDTVSEREMTTGSLNWKKKFTVAPQRSFGISRWAQWVKEEVIKPYDVTWAFEEGDRVKWIAVRIHISIKDFTFSKKPDKETFYFGLRSVSGRENLRVLENEFATYLENLK